MARIRTIKPELWQNEALGSKSRDVRLLFIGLINHSDDEGRQRGSTPLLRSTLFPYDESLTNAEIDAWLDELESIDAIHRYSVTGQKYLHLPSFCKHQVINKPTKSALPPPPVRADYGSAPVGLPVGREGNGMEKEGKGVSPPKADDAPRPDVEGLCRRLAAKIVANDPKAKVAPNSKAWRDSCRLLLDVDGRTVTEVEQIIDFAQADDFWRTNILSMKKLREQFTALLGKMQRHATTNGNSQTASGKLDDQFMVRSDAA